MRESRGDTDLSMEMKPLYQSVPSSPDDQLSRKSSNNGGDDTISIHLESSGQSPHADVASREANTSQSPPEDLESSTTDAQHISDQDTNDDIYRRHRGVCLPPGGAQQSNSRHESHELVFDDMDDVDQTTPKQPDSSACCLRSDIRSLQFIQKCVSCSSTIPQIVEPMQCTSYTQNHCKSCQQITTLAQPIAETERASDVLYKKSVEQDQAVSQGIDTHRYCDGCEHENRQM